MSTTISTPDFIVLTSENYFEWQISVLTIYHGSCTDCSALGLIDKVATDAEWLTYNNADATIGRPIRTLPAALADNATANAVGADSRKRTQYASTANTISALKVKLLVSIGKTNVQLLADPDTGTMFTSERQVMIAMDAKYNVLDETTLRAWKSKLLSPIVATDSIEDFLAASSIIHSYLVRVKQPMAESDKIEIATTALAPRTSAGLAVQQYKILHPNVNDRTFIAYSKYLVEQAPNMTMSTSSMNYAAHATATFDDRVAAAVALQLAGLGFAAGMQARQPILNVPSKRRSPDKYCYVHGHCFSHFGNTCNTMLADPKTYSKAMLNAKDPLAVAGGSIKIAN